MADTGAAWQSGDTAVWQEHLATATVRTIVEALFPTVAEAAGPPSADARTVLLAAPPKEQHDLGLRMAADLFTLAGDRVTYLGADTPVAEIVDAAEALGAQLVVLSASTHFHRLRLLEVVEQLAEALPEAEVAVAGAAFGESAEPWDVTPVLDLTGLAERAERG
jgi:methanogenic corrinoid protein MtbC1